LGADNANQFDVHGHEELVVLGTETRSR
jgi:hypothetical protein